LNGAVSRRHRVRCASRRNGPRKEIVVPSQLQALLDKQAIHEVIQRVCRTMDWLDEAGQASCYWPEAEVDFGFFKGRADAFVPMVMEHERRAVKRFHLVSGIAILLDEERAEVESYGITVGSSDRTGASRMYGGRYLDTFEKRAGEWRIARRTYLLDWSQSFHDGADAAKLEGGSLNVPDISAPNHPLYRRM
jgi:hypothetical protein